MDIIEKEIKSSKEEEREFSISIDDKLSLLKNFSSTQIADKVIECIRKYDIEVCVPFSGDLKRKINIVIKEAEKLDKKKGWYYEEDEDVVVSGPPLLNPSTQGLSLSTEINGYYRYNSKISKSVCPKDNWENDKMIRKAVNYICTNEKKKMKEALSLNRIRVFCLQGNGCRYATAFPISVALWILKREAKIKGRAVECVDPCAGWGDRLMAAILSGEGICSSYTGIDPWRKSNEACQEIYNRFKGPKTPNVRILMESATEIKWPDCDLVFTSPPYGTLECYGYDEDENDKQAWKLGVKFVNLFLIPFLKRAYEATKEKKGRIIINIANISKSKIDSEKNLTGILEKEAMKLGLKLVETFGMSISVRAPKTTHNHGNPLSRGEPFFVFSH